MNPFGLGLGRVVVGEGDFKVTEVEAEDNPVLRVHACNSSIFWLRGFCLTAIVLLTLASASSSMAACLPPGQELPADTVNNFLANPSSIFDSSGDKLTQQVRDLAASNPATLSPIIALLKNASLDQQRSIGSGLGQAAAVLCLRSDPNFAADIQQQIAASQSESARLSYAAMTGNTATGATGAGGGSPGGVGGDTSSSSTKGTGTGTTFFFSAEASKNNGTNYFSGSVTGISGTTGTVLAAQPTSP